MAILMGLISAICWGTNDFMAGQMARRVGVTNALFYTQSFGLAVLTGWLLVHASTVNVVGSSVGFICAILAAICNLSAMAALLRALAGGKASIVAPLVSLYGGITAILSLISGQAMTRAGIAGLALCVVGAFFASTSKSRTGERESRDAVTFALISAGMFGVGFWLQGTFAVRYLGAVGALWIYYLTATIVLFCTLIKRRALAIPQRGVVVLALIIGVSSLTGFLSLAYGAETGHVAIVTVLSSFASGVTVLLGFTIRGERPGYLQWLGIASILPGVILLKLASQATGL